MTRLSAAGLPHGLDVVEDAPNSPVVQATAAN